MAKAGCRLFCGLSLLTLAACGPAALLPPAASSPVAYVETPPAFLATPTASSDTPLALLRHVDDLQIFGAPQDQAAIDDIAEAVKKQAPIACALLGHDCAIRAVIEVYPDQQSFDRHVMNPKYRGFFAISGYGKIQVVSPAMLAPHAPLSYEERKLIAVHELVHLVLNDINPNLPPWLGEGMAVYAGPHAVYSAVCEQGFPFDMMPRLQSLLDAYDNVPAADLFAYTVVWYIASEHGLDRLNALIRAPDRLETLLGSSTEQLEFQWRDFVGRHCKTRGT